MRGLIASLFCGSLFTTPAAGADQDTLLTDFLPGLFEDKGLAPIYSDGYLTFYLDNDLFAGTDEGYTNGARLSWISGERGFEEFGEIQEFLRGAIGDRESIGIFRNVSGFENPDEVKYHFGFSLTQLMFTPQSLTALTPPMGQRPYAAWLGLGYSLHAKDRDTLNSAELTVGIVGPAALGEETQDFIHDLRGYADFEGWDSQLSNEFTLGFTFTQKRTLAITERTRGRFGMDGLTEWGFTLGNFRTNAFGGALIRAGYNLPSAFSDPRLALNAYSLEPFDRSEAQPGSWSAYLLAGARIKISAFDATLNGPLFRNVNTGVERELLVGELYAGFGVRRGDWDVSYVHTFQTREFEEQANDLHTFGSLALRYNF
ncbi:lipid A deacylase LpxR family protein [Akkermansiaceae bacterium]|nr:lipid A deacylase LpxR family protein [bacterium]MDA7537973.1 lipid A deacylase LpxR family protein [Akkermansiaceae bacterium]MDA7863593.1 lipid A deacylase LpxR family protein [Akkermansiaceae bacterium]MDA7877068.1 lipid A deacylase LpxR family protein [Akkermansiaceae bacterium]MDA8967163.1 lipid A deacylase LpxR family protein [Akkermansiaceae bacterium]